VSLALQLDGRSRGLRVIETDKAGASRVKYDTLATGQETRRSFEHLLDKGILQPCAWASPTPQPDAEASGSSRAWSPNHEAGVVGD
jgi:hypothetical protein